MILKCFTPEIHLKKINISKFIPKKRAHIRALFPTSLLFFIKHLKGHTNTQTEQCFNIFETHGIRLTMLCNEAIFIVVSMSVIKAH